MAAPRWDANYAALAAETGMVNNEVAIVDGCTAAGDGGGGTFMFESTPPASATVVAATNTGPIIIRTSAAHGLTTGRRVLVDQVTGNTNANGTRTIWVGGGVLRATNASPIRITATDSATLAWSKPLLTR